MKTETATARPLADQYRNLRQTFQRGGRFYIAVSTGYRLEGDVVEVNADYIVLATDDGLEEPTNVALAHIVTSRRVG